MSTVDTSTLAELDAQIQQYEALTLSLKYQRNKRAPISRLPQEVLLLIFITVTGRDAEYRLDNPGTLRGLTHVCRVWRTVAIGAPILWTRPPIHYCSPQWMKTILQRAKSAPLDLVFISPSQLAPVFMKSILSDMSRIASLVVKGMWLELNNMQGSIAGSSSRLRELQITLHPSYIDEGSEGGGGDFSGSRPFKLATTTFSNTPQLRRIIFQFVDVSFDAPLFSNLTRLSVGHMTRKALPTWVQLTNSLRRMPLLEELHLDHVFPNSAFNNGAASTPTPIDLPCLNNASLKARDASQLVTLLSLLTLHHLKNLTFQWDVDDAPGCTYLSMFHTAALLTRAEAYGGSFKDLTISTPFFSPGICISTRSPGGSHAEIAFPAARHEVQIIMDFIRITCLTHLIHLSIDLGRDEYNYDSLCALLHGLPLLQAVTVGYHNAFTFFDCLEPQHDTQGTQGSARFYLRELKSVIWKEGDLNRNEWWVKNTIPDILEKRRREGIPLQKLSLQNVRGLTQELVDVFEKMIPNVAVDSRVN